ncbi:MULTISPECIES: hypothetical protein [Marinobacter]|uniref:hypothetical protein n=1 Tax=Marinobacter TaxID=2742 RepID=UPI0011129536|nr:MULTISPECIES: hypothetical protein [Marinobacter]MCK5865887.1 hypothetical protein [Marinobacter adhaerens]MCP4061741.1 hypothetical protein [Gammaproteobacteria bacterium]MTI77466.1 hypothetical protein [Marinobacter sp.]
MNSRITGCNNRAIPIKGGSGLCQTPTMAALEDFSPASMRQGSGPTIKSGIKVVQTWPTTH